MTRRPHAWLWLLTAMVVAALLPLPVTACAAMAAGPDTTGSNESSLNLLLLEVTLDGQRLTDDFSAYEHGNDVLLPLGELARLLTIGITVDAATQTASGFVLREDQPFRLDLRASSFLLPSGHAAFDRNLVQWIDGDLHVASRLLQRWLPVDLSLDLAALRLNVRPREQLPLQARMERERTAKKLGRQISDGRDAGYPYMGTDYRLISMPFIDNSLVFGLQKGGDSIRADAAYSGFLTGDLLGMESAIHLAVSSQNSTPEARITLARHDPEAGLLGPLQARTLMLGNIGVPAVDNVMRGAGSGNGLLISNRPLNLPNSYRLQTLRGELLPGWDVTLYFNDALISFQQAREDGLYEFEDQPLVFGRNEFKLVFSGPLGQTRVERQVFEVDQSVTDAGTFFYTAAGQHDDAGGERQTLQFDFGALDNLGVTLGGSYVDSGSGTGGFYINGGARAAVLGALVNIDHVREISGGALTELGLRTSLWGLSIDVTHAWMRDFDSDFFTAGKLKSQDRARMTGAFKLTDRLMIPVSLDIRLEQYASGSEVLEVQQRLSMHLLSTSFTNMMILRASDGPNFLGGVLQMNRRVAGVGLSGQMAYGVKPRARLNSLAITADKTVGDASRVSLGILHSFDQSRTILTAGVNRNFGSFGIGISGRYGSMNDYGVGLQLFTALGRNPQSGRLVSDWRPMAASGMVAARVFIDDNQNGRFDAGEDPVDGAGFKINGGSRHPARTDGDGIAFLNRLTPQSYADIALDAGTLEDAQLQPAVPGIRLLPRSGKAQRIDFPLVIAGGVDGTVYLLDDEGKLRGIGNALVELLNDRGETIGSTRSSSDGFYVLPSVRPGKYRLRISPEQKNELGLIVDHEPVVIMPAEADFINGIDFRLRKLPGVPEDYQGVVEEWRGPAAAGDPDASFNLGQADKLGRDSTPIAQPKSSSRTTDAGGVHPTTERWRVQLGAFSTLDAARTHWQRVIGDFGRVPGLDSYYVNANSLVRLQVGPVATREAARRLCAAITAMRHGCFPVRQ